MTLRALRRSVEEAQRPAKGKPGGRCPKCDAAPLAIVEDWREFGEIAACPRCHWLSATVKNWLLLFLDMEPASPDTLGAAVVRGLTQQQAAERAVRLDLLPDGASILPVGETGDLGVEVDHYLSPAQLALLMPPAA